MLRKIRASLKLPTNRSTAAGQSVIADPPDYVLLPLKQNALSSRQAKPVTKVGDYVYIGQLVAADNGEGTLNVYASVSGTVASVNEEIMLLDGAVPAIRIESDGRMDVYPGLRPPAARDLSDFIAACRTSAIVDMDSGSTPLWEKLDAAHDYYIDDIIIDGTESEPYLTADYHTVLEHPDDIIVGVELLETYIESKRIHICINEDKPEALSKLAKLFAEDEQVIIHPMKSRYPQGAEPVLLKSVLDLIPAKGQEVSKLGAVILNVSTLAKLGEFFIDGMPLTSRLVTVDGSAIAKPQCLDVPIGTPVEHVIKQCGGFSVDPGRVIIGGPLSGQTVMDAELPILGGNNAVLAFDERDCLIPAASECIRCGRCKNVCPVGIDPTVFERAAELSDPDEAGRMLCLAGAGFCIDCGACTYICPSHRPLAAACSEGRRKADEYEAVHYDPEGGME